MSKSSSNPGFHMESANDVGSVSRTSRLHMERIVLLTIQIIGKNWEPTSNKQEFNIKSF